MPNAQISTAGPIQMLLNSNQGARQQIVPCLIFYEQPAQQNLARFQSIICRSQNLKVGPDWTAITLAILMSLCTMPALWHLSSSFSNLQKIRAAYSWSKANDFMTIVSLQGKIDTVLNQDSSRHLLGTLQYLAHRMGYFNVFIMQFSLLNYRGRSSKNLLAILPYPVFISSTKQTSPELPESINLRKQQLQFSYASSSSGKMTGAMLWLQQQLGIRQIYSCQIAMASRSTV